MAVIACRITAIPNSERPRYLDFLRRIRQSVIGANELPDGYEIKLVSDTLSDREFQEWAALEALCCPFLQVRTHPGILRIISAPGVVEAQTAKQLIAHEFLNARR